MSTWTASGPSLDGCHQIDVEIAEAFKRLGGEDIAVWSTEYVIESKTWAAVDYAVSALGLTEPTERPF